MSPVAVTPIPLTRGLIAWVDLADIELVGRFKWFAAKCQNRMYAATTLPGNKRLFMHRLICGGLMVDHKDGDSLNNARLNLRACSSAQNSANKTKGFSATGLRGVFRARGGFVGRIRFDGERFYVGHYTSASHAYANVVAAAKRIHGDFSNYDEPRAAND